ncbi:MAG: aminotransferase class V-fold PLP-dependent enzyme [Candidatus Nanohaloarchaea archaeon]|nr:aminotransferase class V-fold PLP-dependent enzyme [Candidatus Nanohaloarchaea archaeon]
MDPQAYRGDFPGLETTVNGHRLVYLDNAATTQKPVQVLDTAREALERPGNPGRGSHRLSQEAQQRVEDARATVASFIGAGNGDIVFTHNATDSINQLARSLTHYTSGNIVATAADHHGNYLPWKEAARREGLEFREVAVDSDGSIDMDDLAAKVDSETRVLAFPHACNVTGTVFDVEKILEIGEKADYTVMDAAQSVPDMPVDLDGLGVDFAALSPHKMLAPFGTGVLYGRDSLLDETRPTRFGGGMVTDPATLQYRDAPERHEAGTVDLGGIAGTAAAVDYLQDIGMDELHRHVQGLARELHQRLAGIDGVQPLGDQPDTGTVSVTVDGIHSHDLADFLDRHGIATRAGDHCSKPLLQALEVGDALRFSFYLYNTKEELEKAEERFSDALEEIPRVQ